MKCVRIEYRLRPEVSVDEAKAAIADFVSAIAVHHPDHRYTSFQSIDNPQEFLHVGELVEDTIADLQSQPFFQKFSAYLRSHCDNPPKAKFFKRVASAPPANR
jgi:hypothetical protein